MTYREALDWIYAFSDTERTGAFVHDREDNLRRERALLEALGNPHLAYQVTHVAGTKGKGSTAAMLAAILCASGLRVGLYTQPDLHTFRERMRVGERLISEAEVAELVPELRAALEVVGESVGTFITYEVATALAFLYFQRAGVEHAVIEVGLGGRLDATNVVSPSVAIITSISYDHMRVLGNTLAAIAGEKAGIIKPGVPTVSSRQVSEARDVIASVCAQRNSRLITVGLAGTSATYTYRAGAFDNTTQEFDVKGPDEEYQGLSLGLLGEHQLENATTALAAAEVLREVGVAVDERAIREGLRQVRWPGRLQVIGERPLLVVDGAHNADSFARLFAALERHFHGTSYDRLILVVGIMADKDLVGMAREIAQARITRVVATAAANERAMSPERIARELAMVAPLLPVIATPTIADALVLARAEAGAHDGICVTGSLYLVAEALRWFTRFGGAAVMHLPPIDGVDH
ncbi:MAG TPA: folylpolyglutamate synthase/dihydrofolate synthase family protein [Ktedonobacterales bacterium]|nr:folylpolyglutamate synthase/dihydrofolate synthase family protein [Ktedonobacterales bacterium]